ncbi:MAG TPA: nicotinate-nucleotide adenylyltransferase [Burkholderiales bacterium]|nr:nicotinate-nucleotide adenylyltransferase [Burkholderiales bacterium]
MASARLGILGGTFDPVHNAHLAMARAALRALALDRVLFLPTGTTRYRPPAVASGEHRLAMLRLALDDARFGIDARELAPQASGYTVDTLRALRAEQPGGELVLLMGADQYAKLDTWHRPEEVKRLARIAVFARPGVDFDHPLQQEDVKLVPMQPLAVSATEVRRRAAAGEALDSLVPPAVADYIARHRLYS